MQASGRPSRVVLRSLVAATACVTTLSACTGDEPDPASSAEPVACSFVDAATVRKTLGDAVNDPADATVPLTDAPDLLGCRWTTAVGTALTVTVTRTPVDDASVAVARWAEGCATPQPLQVEDAVGSICHDTAFDAAGSELYAIWSGGELTMRLGLQRDGGADPEDADRLRAVARHLVGNITPDAYDDAEASS